MSVVLLSISHSTVDCKLVADKDLHDRNAALVQFTVVREMLYITTKIFLKPMSLYHSTVHLNSAYGAQH